MSLYVGYLVYRRRPRIRVVDRSQADFAVDMAIVG